MKANLLSSTLRSWGMALRSLVVLTARRVAMRYAKRITLLLLCIMGATAFNCVKGDEYVKVTSTSDITDGQYLIVYETGGKAADGSQTANLGNGGYNIDVTISSSKIAVTTTTEAAEFTINVTKKTIKSKGGYYIGRNSNSNGIDKSATTEYENTMTIDGSGNFHCVGKGNAVLRYNTSSNGMFRYYKSSSYTGQKAIQLYKRVSSGNVDVSSVSLNKNSTTITCGSTETLTATVLPSNATDKTVTWSSSNTSVATVDSDGKVTAVSAGSATITATATNGTTATTDDKTATCTVTVSSKGTCATPQLSPTGGTYSSAQTVTMTCSTTGSSIYYTTNGNTPTTSSTKYTGAITVSSTTTVKAIAVADCYTNSSVASVTYTINTGACATPTFSPAAGTYNENQSVTISCATDGATIHYTTDGSTPTASSPTYSSAISVTQTTTIKAIAIKSGLTNSEVASAKYTMKCATPTFSPAAGTYNTTQSVTISCTTPGVTIYYTTDGTTPSTSSTQYTGAISVAVTTTIKAIAVKTGWSNSASANATYTIKCATPTFSPATGTYTSAQSVTISCTTPDVTIYYTTDGTTPTTSSTAYTGAISVTSTQTIKAIAVKTGCTNSAVGSATYTMNIPLSVKWYVGSNTGTPAKTESVSNGGTATPPSNPSSPSNCPDKVFVGWSETWIGTTATNTVPTDLFTGNKTGITADKNFYAVFATASGSSSTVSDVLTRTLTGATGTTYVSWSNKTVTSDAVYGGNTAGGNNSIQFKTASSNTGLYTSGSGGKVRKVTIEWNTSTSNNRSVEVYGKHTAYSAATELFNTTNQGTLLGAISYTNSSTYETELSITDDYEYIGLKATGGALYCTSITIQWESGSTTYSGYVTACAAPTCTSAPTVGKGAYDTSTLTATGVTLTNDNGITNLGGGDCTIDDYGWVYSTTATPTVGGEGCIKVQKGTTYTTTGTAFGSQAITGLVSGTTYYVRTYAHNGSLAGYGYGAQYSFKTASYTVTLDKGNGTVSPTSVKTSNGVVTLPSASPSSACAAAPFNWTFDGWATASVAEGSTTYTKIPAGEYTPSSDITLYAVYKQGSNCTAGVVSSLSVGDEVVLIYQPGLKQYAGQSGSNTYAAKADYTTEPAATHVLEVKAGNQAGTYALYDKTDNVYLSLAQSSNRLDFESSLTDASSWTITFDASNNASILNYSLSGRYILYNINSPRFACYNSVTTTIGAVQLYKICDESYIYATSPTCTTIPVSSISLNKNTLEVDCSSDLTLTATVLPANASNKNVTWSSSNTSVATVSNGEITIVGPGTANIVATSAADNTKFASCAITVPTYTVTLNAGNGTITGGVTTVTGFPCESVTLPTAAPNTPCPDAPFNWVFAGWSETSVSAGSTTATVIPAGSYNINGTKTLYAVYRQGGEEEDAIDVALTGITGTGYTAWSGKTVNTDAVYAGNSSKKSGADAIQMNGTATGIYTTASGGKIKKVTVEWAAGNTNGRALRIYGSNTPFSGVPTSGQIGTIVYGTSTEYTFSTDYDYVAVGGNGNAIYLSNITFTWGAGAASYATSPTCTVVNVSSVTVSPATATIDCGSNQTLTATVLPATATYKDVTWASSNTSVATVSADGKVIAVGPGTATITVTATNGTAATSDDRTATCTVNVPSYTITLHLGSGDMTGSTGEAGSKIKTLTGSPCAAVPLGTATPNAACSALGWEFAGWATASQASTTTLPTLITEYTPTANTDLYAVYTSVVDDGGGAAEYVKVTATGDITNGQYLIVSGTSAFNGGLATLDAANNYITVTVSSNKIAATSDTEDAEFTINATNKTIKSASGLYINRTSGTSGGALATSSTESAHTSLSIDASGNFVAEAANGHELRYNSSDKRFRYYSSGQTAIQLYKKTGGGTQYWETSPACSGTATVTYDANGATGGTVPVDNTTYNLGDEVTVKANTGELVKEGYVFAGWRYQNATTGAIKQAGATFNIATNTTLYANWVKQYTVTIIDNGKSNDVKVNDGATFTLPAEGESTCPDITFLGWHEGEYTDHLAGAATKPTVSKAAGATITVNADITYCAIYQATSGGTGSAGTYTLNYAADVASKTISYGTEVSVTATDGSEWIVKASKQNGMQLNTGKNASIKLPDCPNAITKIVVTLVSGSNKKLTFGTGDRTGDIVTAGTAASTQTLNVTGSNTTGYLYAAEGVSIITNIVVTYGGGITVYTSKPTCCDKPETPLTLAADNTSLVYNGTVNLTVTGGNGNPITWSCKDNTNANKPLTSPTDAGATLTLGNHTAATGTKTYTVTITQEDKETDEGTICGDTKTVTITCKAKYNIKFYYDNGNGSVAIDNNLTLTGLVDGEEYTLPDLSEDFSCDEGHSFVGWALSSTATAVEKQPESTDIANADKIWYGLFQHASTVSTVTRDKYELVTDASKIVANGIYVLAVGAKSKGLALMDDDSSIGPLGNVQMAADGSYLTFESDQNIMPITLQGNSTAWKLYCPAATGTYKYLYNNGAGTLELYESTQTKAQGWTISVADDGKATIADATEDYTSYKLQYNASSPRFACYTSNQTLPQLYKKNGTISVEIASGITINTTNNGCTRDPVIRMTGGQWITSSNGQTVKDSIIGSMKNFAKTSNLTVTSDNEHFVATLKNTSLGNGNNNVVLRIAYTPTEANIYETAEITITANNSTNGDITRTITVNGRSLPDEFVIVTLKNGDWHALPANIATAGNPEGPVVTVNAAHTLVPVAPSTVIYTMRQVADARFASYGHLARLVGNGDRCLWATTAAGQSDIRNFNILSSTNGGQVEWKLATTDGTNYKITLPANTETAAGRQLSCNNLYQFGYFKSECSFLLLPVGCSSQPANVVVTPKRTEAVISWDSNAAEMVINIYKQSAPTTLVKTMTSDGSPATVSGLEELTPYNFTLIPDGATDCAVEGEFTTTGPTIDIVEWMENALIIQVDKDTELHPKVLFAGEVEHGTENVATELFFSKYFEGEGSMKLIAVYNGTRNEISLEGYKIRERGYNSSNVAKSVAENNSTTIDLSKLGSIKAGQEIILFSRPLASETAVYGCSKTFLDQVATKSAANENPRWIECETGNEWGFPKVQFSGNDALLLLKDDVIIDLFGSETGPATGSNCRNNKEYAWTATIKNMDYGKQPEDFSDYTGTTDAEFETFCNNNIIDVSSEEIPIATARCILFRNNEVTSGENAVTENYTTFATLGTEWYGRSVCIPSGVTGAPTCHSYINLAEFDFDRYYRTYSDPTTVELDNSVWDAEQHLYKIDVPNLAQYSCLDMRLQLTPPDDTETVLTETHNQVPIIVAGNKLTTDPIFSDLIHGDYGSSAERCATCNVVVLRNAKLTKAANNAANDVPQVYNIKVYPKGQVVIPTGTTYKAQSLAFRVTEDTISTADIKGTLKIVGTDHANDKTKKAVYLDVRIDPTNWHYITLPFDCNVDDIAFVDGTPAKLGTDYLLKWYDGEYRAEHRTGGWTMVDAGSTMQKGKGYIVGLPGAGKVKHELRFPMSSLALDDEKEAKTVGELYAYGANKSEDELKWNHRGWNMIGNPYMNYYNGSSVTTPLLQGTLEKEISDKGNWTGHWVLNTESGKNLRYVVAPQNHGWGAYTQRTIGNNLEPFTCYFVQIAGDDPATALGINFTTANLHNYSAAPAYLRAPEVNSEQIVWFGVKLTNDKNESDETTLLISDKFTDGYDAMDDLIKMRGDYYKYYTNPVIASRNDEGEMAFNALPDNSAAAGVPLNYFAGKQGEYVIAINNEYPTDGVEEAYLHDINEGVWHNLLLGEYRFVSAKGDNKTRFELVVNVNRKPQSTTAIEDIDYVNGVRLITDGQRIYINGIAEGASVHVFYADGKLLSRNNNVKGGQLAIDAPATGVYTVRVSGTQNAMLKCVIK